MIGRRPAARRVKRTTIWIVGAATLVTALFTGCSNRSAESADESERSEYPAHWWAAVPEDAVRGVFGAIEAVDAEKADGYFTEDVRDQASLVLGLALALIDEFTVSNLTVQVTREGEETAAVDLRFDWEATALGATRSGHAEFLIDLLRAEGGWLVADFSPFEELLTEP